MRNTNKKLLVLVLIFCMIFAMIPVYADVTITGVETNDGINTDGADSSTIWFAKFDSLLGLNKSINGLQFYIVLNSLRNYDDSTYTGDELDAQVASVYNLLSPTDKGYLDAFNIDAGDIYEIMKYYLDTYPASMVDVIDPDYVYGTNIYSDIYHDETLEYSDYMVKFMNYLNRQFVHMPIEMQTPMTTWDVAKQGEIHLFQDILNIIIEGEIFFVVDDRDLGIVTKDMYLEPVVKDIVKGVLEKKAEFNGGTYVQADIDAYANMYFTLGNVILESAELNLKATGVLDNAIALGRFVDLVRDSQIGPTIVDVPSIRVEPTFATVYTDPNPDQGESSDILIDAYVSINGVLVPNAEVRWTVVEGANSDAILIDANGLVTVNPAHTIPEAEQVTATVRAEAVGRNISADSTIIVVNNAPLGASFFGPYISGYEDGTFRLSRNVTRAEAATMMTRVLSFDTKKLLGTDVLIYPKNKFAIPSYSDIQPAHWAYLYIEIAKAEGILGGYDDGTFRPDEPMTRAEIALMIFNSWTALGIDKDVTAKHVITDVGPDHWAAEAINSVYNAVIVDGYEDNSFRPDENTRREHIVVMINNLIDRPEYKLPNNKFSDVAFDYWAFGDVIAATMYQSGLILTEQDPVDTETAEQ